MGILKSCKPRKEVLKGDLDDAIFAADFGDLIAKKAPKVYGDATTFFQNTHPAKQLCKVITAVFDRLARHKPSATIAGFALSPLAAAAAPEITTAIAHLRDVLGGATYESLARKGETMTAAAMVTYAYDQIDQARTELEAVSK